MWAAGIVYLYVLILVAHKVVVSVSAVEVAEFVLVVVVVEMRTSVLTGQQLVVGLALSVMILDTTLLVVRAGQFVIDKAQDVMVIICQASDYRFQAINYAWPGSLTERNAYGGHQDGTGGMCIRCPEPIL